MNADLMLRWMSETGEGSLRDLRLRVAWLAGLAGTHIDRSTTGRWARDMSALAHAEIAWDTDRWAVNPPLISRLPAADGTAVLTGSRWPRLVDCLEATNLIVHTATAERSPSDLAAPTVILLQFDNTDILRDAAAHVGVQYVGCAASILAARLRALSLGPPSPPPSTNNETLERLTDAEYIAFSPSVGVTDGVYRLRLAGHPAYLYRLDGNWFHCDLASGIFTEHARHGRSVMRWRPDGHRRADVGTLFVDWGSPLPLQQARALTLCSGFPARFSSAARTSIFINVPYTVASAVASSLSQSLQPA